VLRMSTFTDEIEYLNSQPLGRIATVGADGRPHVMPVGVFYDLDLEAIVIGGAGDMAASKKFRDARRRREVAVVVDDLASIAPWLPRGIEIRGPRRRTPPAARRWASASAQASRSNRRGSESGRGAC
jgi:pyridoxamine 5'-phosphate oxidase family protein